MRFLVLLILLLIGDCAMSQESYGPRIDSLIRMAEQPGRKDADSLYMEAGHWLAYQKTQDAFPYLERSLQLAELNHRYRIMCMAYSFLGIASGRIGSYDNAVQYFKTQINLAKTNGFIDEVAWANNNIGLVLLELQNYEISNIYLREAKDIADSLGDDNIRQYVYSNLGRLLLEVDEFDSSEYYFHKVLEIRKRPPIDSINLAATYRDLGNAHFRDMEYEEAKYYYGVSKSLIDSSVSNISAWSDVNLAQIYMYENKTDSALAFVHASVSLARRFNDRLVLFYAYGVMGTLYYDMGNYAKAERCLFNQILYQDTLKSTNVVNKVYELLFQKQIYDQQQNLLVSKAKTKSNIILCVMLFLLVVGGVYFALRFRHKERIIRSMNIELEHQNKQTNDSIAYAQKIQTAVLPDIDDLGRNVHDKFMLYRPKEMVSGNFFWAHSSHGYDMLALCDAGESGVPGGFLSMLGSSILHEIAEKDTDPSRILELLRDNVLDVIHKAKTDSSTTQSLDISLAVMDSEAATLHYSGVKFPILLIRDGEVFQIQDNVETNTFYNTDFTTASVELKDGDCLYMTTQGMCSQENEAGERLGLSRLSEKLLEIHQKPMDEQRQILLDYLDQWRGNCPQQDDLLMSGGVFNINTETR